jgi:hypothetical protein
MVHLSEVEKQLKRIGADFKFWGKPEMRELQHILVPGEQITHCLNGRYDGWFAMMCSTDMRLLLVDKKPMYLTVEDIRYDMISEVDYSHRFLDAMTRVCTPNKTILFKSMKHKELRALTGYVQQRVMELRQMQSYQQAPATDNGMGQQQGQVAPASPFASQVAQPQQVRPLQYMATNPYTKIPLMMRRRISRFHQ